MIELLIFFAVPVVTAIAIYCLVAGIRVMYLDKSTYALVSRWKHSDYVMSRYGRYLMCRISRNQLQCEMSQFHNDRMGAFQGFTFDDDALDECIEEGLRERREKIAKENNHLDDDLFHL